MVARALAPIAVVAVLAGCGADGPAERSTTGSVTASPTPTTAPITAIPAAAFLQPEDLGEGHFVEGGSSSTTLAPCPNAPLRSDRLTSVREQIVGVYDFTPGPAGRAPDGTINQVITAYREDGAAAYLAEVREQLSRCASTLIEDTTYANSVVAEGIGGDDSVLWDRTSSGTYGGFYDEIHTLVAVIRIRQVVIVLDSAGRVAPRAYVDRLVAAAMTRATNLPVA